jgi:diacylglycerol kinase family enzyme
MVRRDGRGHRLLPLDRRHLRARLLSHGTHDRPGLIDLPSESRSGWRVADPPQRPALFVNPNSGGGKAVRAGLAERARDRGIDVIVMRPDETLEVLVGEAVSRGADALGVAGGDGSLAVVAAAALVHGLPFVCVPAGTRNHFALDLGVDRRDLVGSLEAFTDGLERRIDVAEVNSRLFLNNVSFGIYGDAVRRPTYRDAKTRTLLETAAEAIGPSGPAAELQLVDDHGRRHANPAVVLVSNNPYSLVPPLVPGTRPTLDSGELGIIVLERPRLVRSPGLTWSATRLEVTARAPLNGGVDGEAVALSPPLRFVIRPRALRVRISSSHLDVSPSSRLP